MRLKNILIVISVVLLLLALGISGVFLGAGNYGYAQKYEFNITDKVLIESIKKLKKQNPEFDIPEEVGLDDSLDSIRNFYHAYFYYRKENKIVHLYVSGDSDNSNKSSINLEALNAGLVLGRWKQINRDFDRSENIKIKKQFEIEVLNKLNLPYTDQGNDMFIFWK